MNKWDRVIEQICEGVKPTMRSKSMSKLSETNELIEKMNTVSGVVSVSADAIIATFLGDIALSLAIIADKMVEQEHE